MYECSNCESLIKVGQNYCKNCGARLIWENAEEKKPDQDFKKDAKSQLVGIKIITIFGIILYGVIWLASIFESFGIGVNEGFVVFLFYTLKRQRLKTTVSRFLSELDQSYLTKLIDPRIKRIFKKRQLIKDKKNQPSLF